MYRHAIKYHTSKHKYVCMYNMQRYIMQYRYLFYVALHNSWTCYDLNTHGEMEQKTLKLLKSMVKMKNNYIYLEFDFNIDLCLKGFKLYLWRGNAFSGSCSSVHISCLGFYLVFVRSFYISWNEWEIYPPKMFRKVEMKLKNEVRKIISW